MNLDALATSTLDSPCCHCLYRQSACKCCVAYLPQISSCGISDQSQKCLYGWRSPDLWPAKRIGTQRLIQAILLRSRSKARCSFGRTVLEADNVNRRGTMVHVATDNKGDIRQRPQPAPSNATSAHRKLYPRGHSDSPQVSLVRISL